MRSPVRGTRNHGRWRTTGSSTRSRPSASSARIDERRERLADRPDLEQRVGSHRPARADLGDPVGPADQQPLTVGHRQREPRDGPVGSLGLDLGVERGRAASTAWARAASAAERDMLGMMAPWNPLDEADARPDRTAGSGPTAAMAPAIRAASGTAPTPLDAVDVARFPDLETRRAIDGGAASARFRALLRRAGRSWRTGRWARCSSRPACSSATRPRSGTSPTPTSSAGSSAPTSRPARRSSSRTPSAGTGCGSSSAATRTASTT